MPELLRQWFVPGDGIDRSVITSLIQRFLGNDATVRPGVDEKKEVEGYWIKAQRTLTSEMIVDLKRETQNWRREQSRTGTRGSHSPMPYGGARGSAPDMSTDGYAHSETRERSYRDGIRSARPSGDSPMRDPQYPPHQQPQRDRDSRPQHSSQMHMDPMPMEHSQGSRMPPQDQMPPQDMRYPPNGQYYPPDVRPYPPDGRPYHQDGRPYHPDSRPFSQDHPMQDPQYGWPPEPAPFGQDPRYAPNYPPGPLDAPGPGYGRPGGGYVPVTSGFEPSPGMAPTSRSESVPFGGSSQYGGPPPGQQGREPPRFGQNDYDPRYPYPSPATSSSSMAIPPRESVTSPSQPSYPPPQGQFPDQYGGRPAQSNYGNQGLDPGYPPPPPSRDHGFANASRERLPVTQPPSEYGSNSGSSMPRDPPRDRQPPPPSDKRDARRRRVQ